MSALPPTALTGRLLLATPSLTDPNFRRAVVLVLNHDEDGALGVVVNRPLEVDVDAVLPGWQPFATAPGKLFQGGPVALDSALGLVAVPGDRPDPRGVRRVFASVGLGSVGLVDLDTPPEAVVDELAGLRIFAGYAGWGAGQLEAEIAEDSWFVLPAEARDAFSDDPERLWADVLRRQGGDLALVASFPADVTMN
ncbi:YqgE/AlgH family protein [Kineococcus sp. T90]|nr:YqgE/AlgH family protein [Kineococcus indalonis]NAZ87603.1 YqgE/AlgH family protein [Kineococcus indalonis]